MYVCESKELLYYVSEGGKDMKEWNTPDIEEVKIQKTENGREKDVFESNEYYLSTTNSPS